jgi:drug/metabolite transporter (DMT)-like permease
MTLPVRSRAAPERAQELTATVQALSHAHWGLTDLSLLMMSLIWAINFSVVKFGTSLVAPLAYNGVRVALAAVALVLIAHASLKRAAQPASWPARRDALALLGLGTLGNGLYQILFILGVSRTRAGDAAIVTAASPAFIALIGWMHGLERIAARGVLGIALSVAGIGAVAFGGAHGGEGTATLFGDALILCGAVCWSIYSVALQPYTRRVSGLPVAALTMTGGAIPLLLVGALPIAATKWSALPGLAWGAIAFSGLGALVIAYLFWYRGVRILGPTRTAMYSNLQPAFAVLIAWLVLGEMPTFWQGIGTASIMSGLLLTRA